MGNQIGRKLNTVQIATIIAVLAIASKVIGFVREMLMANYFGTSDVVDAYVISTNIPNIIFMGLLGAVAKAFVPLYSKIKENEGEEAGNLFYSRTLNILTVITLTSSVLGIIFSRQFVFIFANGWFSNPEMAGAIDMASFFIKISFSFAFFSALGEVMASYLKYRGVYIRNVFADYCISLFSIVFIILAYYYGYQLLIFGILGGQAMRFFILARLSKKEKYKHKFDFKLNDTIKQIFALTLPIFWGSTMSQINQFINRQLASSLPEGSISALNYGALLMGLVGAITSYVLGILVYPKLAKAENTNNPKQWDNMVLTGLNIIWIVAVPLQMVFLYYSRFLVQVVFERNEFDVASTDLTSIAFFYYSIGIALSLSTGLLVQAFYSKSEMMLPMKIALFTLSVHIVLNIILVQFLYLGGLALGSSIANSLQGILLLIFLKRRKWLSLDMKYLKSVVKIVISAVISFICLVLIDTFAFSVLWPEGPALARFLISLAIATGIYFLLLKKLKIREISLLRNIIRRA